MIAAPLLALVLAAPPACALPPLAQGEPPWRTGEALTFDLDVLGMVKAGSLQTSVEPPMSAGRVIPLRARAKTDSNVASLKRVTGVALSWIDARTLLPERYRDEAVEGGQHRVSDTRLAPASAEVTIAYRSGDRDAKTSYRRERDVLDAVSAFYYLRAARLAPGEPFCFDLVANRRLWRFEGSVAAKPEKVETPAGRFETIRIDGVARRADDSGARARPVHLWISTDARRLPVAAVSEIDLGPVRAMLSGVRGARKP